LAPPQLSARSSPATLWLGIMGSLSLFHVSTQGLDLSQPAGAHQFYRRLQQAARVACRMATGSTWAPALDPAGCYEKALGDAIRSANVPLVTQFYLVTHTLGEAAARGIDVPAQMAAK